MTAFLDAQFNKFSEPNKTLLFVLLVFTFILFSLIIEEFFISDELYYDHFQNDLTLEKIQEVLDFKEKWGWLTYILIPIIYLFKFSLISIWLLVGVVFFGYRASYKKLVELVIISEFVFLLPVLIKAIWFGFIQTDYTLQDLSYFTPLSLANYFDPSSLDVWWTYPLQAINVFEVLYILVLSVGIKRIIQKDYGKSLQFTIQVYGSGLLVWIIFITFLTLNFSN